MKKIVTSLSFSFLIFINFATSQSYMTDSVYIYNEKGVPEWYYIQKDVFCFALTDNSKYTGTLSPCVDTLVFYSNGHTLFNEINFNATSTDLQRHNQFLQIQDSPNYGVLSVALTKIDTATYTSQKYYRTDDKILITFNNPLLDYNTINVFASTYNLELVHKPSTLLNKSVSWTYVFRLIPNRKKPITTIKLAQILNENESTLIKLAEPNVYSVEPLTCTPTAEVGLTPGNINGTWHIRNTGGIIWGGQAGVNNADADICECWGEGYTGAGIKVGIIDFGGIEFTHDDFEGTNIPKAYNAVIDDYETTNFALNSLDGHAMQVTGVIAATPNNSHLEQRWAVGVAYNSTVIPYVIQLTDAVVTNEQVTISLQKAIEDSVDVINMSFRTNASVGTINLQLENATTIGRPDPNNSDVYRGIVCVAGVGNDDLVASNFPANMPNVIGVGWSNPEDYRCAYTAPGAGGGWTTNTMQGSTYGPPEYNYDVVAPGDVIMTTNLSSAGSPYTVTLGSSIASPIVAGIAAMILEKNPNLTWSEVKQLIRDGAEKVRPSVYDYNMFAGTPGYNNEMFYGRVSCVNSINQTPLGVKNTEKLKKLTVMNMGDYNYLVFMPQSGDYQDYELYDMSGRLLMNGKTLPFETEISVDLSSYTNGIYILKIYNSKKTVFSTKLIK